MSIKSLLQLILLALIVLIIGGIYFLYFYSNSNDEILNYKKNLEEMNVNDVKENLMENSINLEDKKVELKQNDNIKLKNDKTEENNELNGNKNLTKDIEYLTTDNDGNKYKIIAKLGETSTKDSNILKLTKVDGIVSSKIQGDIKISSEFAEYNYSNQNSKFYKNVKIYYDNKEISCDNLDLNISKNIAVAYNNVIINDNNSILKADNITMDILTKDIKINSNKKIKVLSN
tara:strand:+ start:297 stop:989 length:693 start_codon:yes stop_codon:yes gene_type:complete